MQVYWGARRLDSFYLADGNHHFVLIVVEKGESLRNIFPVKVPGEDFKIATLAAYGINGYLKFRPNVTQDTQWLTHTFRFMTKRWLRCFFDVHYVSPPRGSDHAFALKLESLAIRFVVNSGRVKPRYSITDSNCASFVNTMFKVAGVSAAARTKAGGFCGIDWGEDKLLDEKLFR